MKKHNASSTLDMALYMVVVVGPTKYPLGIMPF